MRRLHRSRRRWVPSSVLVAVLVSAATCLAYYTSSGAGSATASVGSIDAPATVTVAQSGSGVTIAWSAATLANGSGVQGYEVTRSDGIVVCGSPALVTALSCTDAAVPTGTYSYTVSAVYDSWSASAASGPITILTTPAITADPANPSASPAAGFSFSGGGASSYQCQLDSGAVTPCSSPESYSGLSDGTHSFTVNAAQGSSSGPVATYTWVVDTTPPAQSFAITSAAGHAYLSAGTIYYNGNVGGSFKLVDTLGDPGSGPASAAFGDIAASGWTHNAETVTTPAGGPYTSHPFTWSSTPGNPIGYVVTGTDNLGNSAPAALAFVSDTTAPTGGALTVGGTAAVAGDPMVYSTSLSFPISSRSDYSDAQSGLASSTLTVQSETESAGSCGAPGSGGPFTSPETITATTQPSGFQDGFCYLYTLTGTDNVGNSASISATVAVDTTAPTTPGLSFSGLSSNAFYSSAANTLYVRPAAGGTFTVTAASTDAQSAIESGNSGYTFGSLAAGNFTLTQTAGQAAYTFGAGATAPGSAATVLATDNAGLSSSTTSYSLVSDTTAPAGGAVAAPARANTASAAVTFGAGIDSQSGVNTASGQLLRATATYTPATDTCGSFGAFGQIGATGLSSPYTDAVSTGRCYEYEYMVSDNVGNSVTYGPSSPLKVNTTGPTVTAISSQDSGGTAATGLVAAGDQLIITFSEPLSAGTVPTSFAATATSGGCPIATGSGECRSAGDVMLVIPGITAAAGADTGSTGYIKGNSAKTVGVGGTIALSSNNTVVTLTVTSVTGFMPAASSGTLAYAPPSSIQDNFGNAATGTFSTAATFKLF
jgi:hypothetical protein